MNLIERAKKLRKMIEELSSHMTEEEVLNNIELLPMWKPNEKYKMGQKVSYNGIAYKVLSDHDSLEAWTPIDTPSLFAKVLIPNEDIISEWEQPESTNPYKKGDKVKHKDQIWISEYEDNVWEPGEFGWILA